MIDAYIGRIGHKVTVDARLSAVIPYESLFGKGYVCIFMTADNEKLVWRTNIPDLKEGTHYHIVGTVRSHETYRDQKQTELKNCTLEATDYDGRTI